MRSLLKRLLLPSDVRPRRILGGPASGLVMAIDPGRELRQWLGFYEMELNRHFRRLVRPGTQCFDVGGAAGYHALMLAKLSEAPILVFEPGAGWPEKIRAELARNGLAGEVLQMLVGARVADGTITLDAAADAHFVPDFIKMDIEGAEADALAGASGLLSSRRPHLIIETHGAEVEDQCVGLLAGHGYVPVVVDPRRWWAEQRPMGHNRWLVCEGVWPSGRDGARSTQG